MISYTLQCADGHKVQSWFKSASAYEALEKAGHLSCAVCGSAEISKSLMTPQVSTSLPRAEAMRDAAPDAASQTMPVLTNPQSDVEKAVANLRRKVEENSDYVGKDFAKQARAMHSGDVPERSIYGEARLDQAKALAEEGVPVMPLPFRPKQKLS